MTGEAPASPTGTAAPRGAAVIFIFVTILLDTLALGVSIPVLPKLIESFVDNDTASAARMFGVFGTAWAVMQFFFSPILGALSDRFGRLGHEGRLRLCANGLAFSRKVIRIGVPGSSKDSRSELTR